jgi:hypothetical protein
MELEIWSLTAGPNSIKADSYHVVCFDYIPGGGKSYNSMVTSMRAPGAPGALTTALVGQ